MAGTTLNLEDVQRAKSEKGDEYGAAVVEMFRQTCDVADVIPFKTLGTTEIKHRRTNSIPTVGFRAGRGQRFGTVAGITYDQVTDAVFSLGAEIDIDKTDMRDKLAGDVLGERTRNAVLGMSWTFKDYFINGDHATDAHGFEGLKVRLTNLPASQLVYANTSSAELDIRPAATPSEATLYSFLDGIDNAIDQLDGSTGDIVLARSDFIARLRAVLRLLGKYTKQPEQEPGFFGQSRKQKSATQSNKPVLMYPEDRPLKWYDMGLKADQATQVIGTETVNGQACSPIYLVKVGMPAYVHGIQQYPMEIDGPTKLDDRVTFRTVVDWPVGLHHTHNRSIVKYTGARVA